MYRLVVVALIGLFCTGRSAAQQPIAIRNVTVIPMTDVAVRRGQTVIVQDGRIAQIGDAASVRVPRGAAVVDGNGKFLIPGLFDMHVHSSKVRASALGLLVLHGVTTVRDQGSEPAEVLRWRQEIRAGTRIGPRMLIAGPYLESLRNIERMRRDPPESRVEPFERARLAVASPADARRIVDSLAPLGFDHLKVRTVQDRETYLALNAAAHARGLRLVGHAVTSVPDLFLEAGQDGVEHGFPAAFDSLADSTRMKFWRELARRDVGVVPTFITAKASGFGSQAEYRALVDDTASATNPLRRYLSAFLILDWREQADEVTPDRRAFFERAFPSGVARVREMVRAGVRVMTGTDIGVLNVFPGSALHDELRLFVDSLGMSPHDALASATRRPAEWLGLADSVGTIEPGKVADLILLDADPLADIGNTRRIAAVILRGRLFRRNDLEALLAAVAASPDLRANDWVR